MKKHQATNQIPSLNKFESLIFCPPRIFRHCLKTSFAIKVCPNLQRSIQKLHQVFRCHPLQWAPPGEVDWVWMQVDHFWNLKKVLNSLGWPNVSVSFVDIFWQTFFVREKQIFSTIKVAKLRESFPLLVFKGLDKVIVFSSSQPWRREWCHRFESGTRSGVLGFVPPGEKLLTVMTLKNMEMKNVPFRVDVFPSSNQLSRVDRWAKSQLLVNTCPTLSSRILGMI